MSTTTKSKTTVTVDLKKGASFIFEAPEVNRIEGASVLVIGEASRALRFPLDSVKTVRVVPAKESDVIDELTKLYASAFTSPYRYSYHNPFGG